MRSAFSPKTRHNPKNNNIFIIIIILIVFLSVGYLGKSMLASIKDANDFENIFDGVRIQYIEPTELLDRMAENPDLMLVDVRASDDYEWEHIKDSVNIPLNELISYYETIQKDSEIVTFCDSSDCEYSKIAARRLLREGYTDVSVLYEGIDGLKNNDFTVIRSDKNEVIEDIFKTESISLEDYKQEIKSNPNNLSVIDIRNKEKYDKDHLSDAIWVDVELINEFLDNLSDEKRIIFITDDFEEAIRIGSNIYDKGYFGSRYLIVD